MPLNLGHITNRKLSQLDNDPIPELLMIQQELHSYTDPSALIALYDRNKNFHEMFNKDGHALENLDKYIDASNEGLIQDVLSYGLAGFVSTLWFENLAWIKSQCKYLSTTRPKRVTQNWSIYLPEYNKFQEAMTRMDAMRAALKQLIKNPDADISKVVAVLKKAGMEISDQGDAKSLVSTDWRAVAGALIGMTIDAVALLLAGRILQTTVYLDHAHAIGGNFGAHLLSKNGGSIELRGWTSSRLGQAAAKIVQLIDDLDWMKQKPAFKKDDPALKYKMRFVKTIVRAYITSLRALGRGVSRARTSI